MLIEPIARQAGVGMSASFEHRARLKSRTLALIVALAIEILVLLALMTLGSFTATEKKQGEVIKLKSFSLDHADPKKKASKRTAAPAKAAQAVVAKSKPKQPKIPIKKAAQPDQPFIEMSTDDMAAADISKLSSRATGSGQTKGKDSGSSYGPGQGPSGAHLYNAEWYREPSHGELAYYLPHGAPEDSYAVIACRTVAHYHVENCVGLSESPPGFGLAKAMRLASWQFLVKPPNVDGNPLIGSWVRIRFDWNEAAEKR